MHLLLRVTEIWVTGVIISSIKRGVIVISIFELSHADF